MSTAPSNSKNKKNHKKGGRGNGRQNNENNHRDGRRQRYVPPTFPKPLVDSLEIFPGVTVRYRLVKGTEIGFKAVGEDESLKFGEVMSDPKKEMSELFVSIDDSSPALQALHSTEGTPGKLFVFTKTGDGSVKIHAESHRKGRNTYRQTVRISKSGERVFVDSSSNNLYIAMMNGSILTIKAVALVRQDNRFWVLSQTAYQSSLHQQDGLPLYPVLHRQHGGLKSLGENKVVTDYLNSLTDTEKRDLPSVEDYLDEMVNHHGLKDNEIRVKLWSLRRQNGVGLTSDGKQVRLFYRDVKGDFPRALQTGDICTIRGLDAIPEKVWRRQGTSLRWDAREIRRVS